MADANGDGVAEYMEGNISHVCTSWAPIVGFAGVASAVVFASKYHTHKHEKKPLNKPWRKDKHECQHWFEIGAEKITKLA
jgi:hypothetical protein